MNTFTRPILILAATTMLLPACSSDSRDYSQEFLDIQTRLDTIEDKLAAPVPNEVSAGVPYYDATGDTVPQPDIIVPNPVIDGTRYVACPIAVTQTGCHADWIDYGLSPTLALSPLDIFAGMTFCTVDRGAGRYTEYSVMTDVTFSGSIPVFDVQLNARGAADQQAMPTSVLGIGAIQGSTTPTADRLELSFPGSCDIYLGGATTGFSLGEGHENEGGTSD